VHSLGLENILYLQTSPDSPDMPNLAYNSGFLKMGQSHLYISPELFDDCAQKTIIVNGILNYFLSLIIILSLSKRIENVSP